jgi:hypothetical protein
VKTCSDCLTEKPESEFARNRGYLTKRCKPCYAAYVKTLPSYNAEARRRSKFKARYGMTVDEYDEMHERQQGLCAICGNSEPNVDRRTGEPMRLSVDHDHETGRVRGLLCQKCNRALGLLDDDVDRLKWAIDYLQRGCEQDRQGNRACVDDPVGGRV